MNLTQDGALHKQDRHCQSAASAYDRSGGLGQNGWGTGYLGEYVFEVVTTFLFLVVTLPFTPAGFAGLATGLTLAVIDVLAYNPISLDASVKRGTG